MSDIEELADLFRKMAIEEVPDQVNQLPDADAIKAYKLVERRAFKENPDLTNKFAAALNERLSRLGSDTCATPAPKTAPKPVPATPPKPTPPSSNQGSVPKAPVAAPSIEANLKAAQEEIGSLNSLLEARENELRELQEKYDELEALISTKEDAIEQLGRDLNYQYLVGLAFTAGNPRGTDPEAMGQWRESIRSVASYDQVGPAYPTPEVKRLLDQYPAPPGMFAAAVGAMGAAVKSIASTLGFGGDNGGDNGTTVVDYSKTELGQAVWESAQDVLISLETWRGVPESPLSGTWAAVLNLYEDFISKLEKKLESTRVLRETQREVLYFFTRLYAGIRSTDLPGSLVFENGSFSSWFGVAGYGTIASAAGANIGSATRLLAGLGTVPAPIVLIARAIQIKYDGTKDKEQKTERLLGADVLRKISGGPNFMVNGLLGLFQTKSGIKFSNGTIDDRVRVNGTLVPYDAMLKLVEPSDTYRNSKAADVATLASTYTSALLDLTTLYNSVWKYAWMQKQTADQLNAYYVLAHAVIGSVVFGIYDVGQKTQSVFLLFSKPPKDKANKTIQTAASAADATTVESGGLFQVPRRLLKPLDVAISNDKTMQAFSRRYVDAIASFGTLRGLLADLSSGDDELTVLVPTDAALEKYLGRESTKLAIRDSRGAADAYLLRVLLYHVVDAKLRFADYVPQKLGNKPREIVQPTKTSDRAEMRITTLAYDDKRGGSLTINGRPGFGIGGRVRARNGTYYSIDRVVEPPPHSMERVSKLVTLPPALAGDSGAVSSSESSDSEWSESDDEDEQHDSALTEENSDELVGTNYSAQTNWLPPAPVNRLPPAPVNRLPPAPVDRRVANGAPEPADRGAAWSVTNGTAQPTASTKVRDFAAFQHVLHVSGAHDSIVRERNKGEQVSIIAPSAQALERAGIVDVSAVKPSEALTQFAMAHVVVGDDAAAHSAAAHFAYPGDSAVPVRIIESALVPLTVNSQCPASDAKFAMAQKLADQLVQRAAVARTGAELASLGADLTAYKADYEKPQRALIAAKLETALARNTRLAVVDKVDFERQLERFER
jgi:uncharacterized surface protein with fasciclin (FAS1) repeats